MTPADLPRARAQPPPQGGPGAGTTPAAVAGEDVLEALFTQSPVGLLIFDAQLRYVRVNAPMARMAGVPEAQLLGRRLREAFPDYGAVADALEEVLATGRPVLGMPVLGGIPDDEAAHEGPRRWSLSAYRLTGTDGRVTGVVVTSTEVTESARATRLLAHAQGRLQLLAHSAALLETTLDVDATLTALMDLLVPAMARWAAVHLVEDAAGPGTPRVRLAAVRHADPARQEALAVLLTAFQVRLDQPYGAGHVIATGRTQELPEVTRDMIRAVAGGDTAVVSGFAAFADGWGLVVPLTARGRTLGALSLVLPRDPEPSGEHPDAGLAERGLAEDVGRRAGLAVDNALLYAQQRRAAVTLQRSLLPRNLPDVEGVDLAARYLPGAAGLEVGGDFYDAVPRRDGTLTVAVGDVMGRGLRAAAVMGQVRASLRAYAVEGHDPLAILRRLNLLVLTLDDAELVTALVAHLDPAGGVLHVANAGHLPPVRAGAAPGAPAQLLDVDPGVPLGVAGHPFALQRWTLAPGELLLLYTDGLVETRGAPLGDRLELLRAVAGTMAGDRGASDTCDAVLAQLVGGGGEDDVAVLAVRRHGGRNGAAEGAP